MPMAVDRNERAPVGRFFVAHTDDEAYAERISMNDPNKCWWRGRLGFRPGAFFVAAILAAFGFK
jgi:hypothetical protein